MSGERLACLYSFGCRKVKKLETGPALSAFIRNGGNSKEIRQILKQLESFKAYQALASAEEMPADPFHSQVVRTYWLGDERMFDEPAPLIFHNYSVVIPWAGIRIFKQLLKAMNLCKISWGRVRKIASHSLMVNSFVLATKKKNGRILVLAGKTLLVDRGFIKKVEVNDWVTFHFNIGREVITAEEAQRLKELTIISLDVFNQKAKA